MSVVYIALPLALLLALAGLVAFIWSVRAGQMDDLETPALRILSEEDERDSQPDPVTEDTSSPVTRSASRRRRRKTGSLR
ncbi:MAG: cbb3-type cytochrome oxidase assembly protein CcoS [Thermoanaerobaculales bacterium]